MNKAIRLAASIACMLSARVLLAEEPGDLAKCYTGAGTAYLYCTNHGYPLADCQRDHEWTLTQCAIQYPY
jgi:hypothetical protein